MHIYPYTNYKTIYVFELQRARTLNMEGNTTAWFDLGQYLAYVKYNLNITYKPGIFITNASFSKYI